MADYYSGDLANIQRNMQQIGVGSSRVDVITPETVAVYQAETDLLIDSTLSQVYFVPLKKVIRAGSTDPRWPSGIEYIAARMVAADIVLNEYTEVEPNTSQTAVSERARALNELYELINSTPVGAMGASRRLEGQRMKARLRFVNPNITPSTPPSRGGGTPGV